MKYVAPVQFITPDGISEDALLTFLDRVLLAGVRWVQFRRKQGAYREVLELLREVSKRCCASGAQLIVNDRVEMASEILCNGVHLGQSDMPLARAREILGDDKIIGATANSTEEVHRIVSEGISDYIGLGPYKHTETKKNLAPILGFLGTQRIVFEAKVMECTLPIIGVGGITGEDLPSIKKAGCYGFAACSMFLDDTNLKPTVQKSRSIFPEKGSVVA